MHSYIKFISTYLPEQVLTNEELSTRFPEWDSEKIFNKIGISSRHFAAQDEFCSDMAVKAVAKLLEEHNIDKESIDFLIVCTQSPDYKLPTTACIVQEAVGFRNSCGAIDVNQGCSGYIYSLALASSLVSSGQCKNVIVVTSELYTKSIHPNDKGNLSLFGDAATATLVSTEGQYRIGKFNFGSDGSGKENLIIKNGGGKNQVDLDDENLDNFLYMNGGEIFNFTSKSVPVLVEENLESNQVVKEEMDLFVFHQANTFMLNFLRKRINIPEDKFLVNMENYGNTVSSSIPLAFADYYKNNYSKVMLVGFGVGYSWGAVTLFN